MLRAIAFGAACAALSPRAAAACGGFFCDGGGAPPAPGQPPGLVVEQAAERIVFVVDETRVRSIIQIEYAGDPIDFAWVVPVPSRPTIDVADPAIFETLDGVTAPQFVGPSDGGGSVSRSSGCDPGCGAESGDYGFATSVRIDSVATIGPYSVTVVTARETSDLVDWLSANVYVVPDGAEDLIGRYVDDGFFFVAVRLQADADVSTIQPLVLDLEGAEPCVPLELTRIAARPDMEVLLWIVGDAQAAPTTYASTNVSDADLSLVGAAGYDDLLRAAVDRAGGRAFVTEMAVPTSRIPDLSEWSEEAESIVRSGRYLTRLRTRMDPEEMTADPVFAFDPDLADVSNVRVLSPAWSARAGGRDVSLASVVPAFAIVALALTRRRQR